MLFFKVLKLTKNPPTPPIITVKQNPTQYCSICKEPLGQPDPNGDIEIASLLPCGHIFGSQCITRWLQTSPHTSCPHCRRKMTYGMCGHIIKPCALPHAPPCVREEEMPEDCIVCRATGTGHGKLLEELRLRNERRLLEERTLEGLREHLPRVFGMSMCWHTVESVDARIEEVRRECRRDIEALCWEFEAGEGRVRW